MAQPTGAAGKKVIFHVGAPKSGTTYLQSVFFKNKDVLGANGVLYPYATPGESFRSMLDFRGVGWGGSRRAAYRGEWAEVAGRARDWTGHTVLISNELLGGARPNRIARGLASVQPADVHVVFTARDFARQLVSDWQEHIKHKHTVPLEQFVDDLIQYGIQGPAPFGKMFWGMHDAGFVLGRWAQTVPRDNIHIVTVPQSSSPRGTLWRRFCEATGLDADGYDTEVKRSNPSMGVAEAELIRRMNFAVKGMADESYDAIVRRMLAEDVLAGRSAKILLPAGRMPWVENRSRQLISELTAAGYPVVGDLAELMPSPEQQAGYVSPTELTEADLASPAIRAATALLKHSGRQRRRIAELQSHEVGPRPPHRRPRVKTRDLYSSARGRLGHLVRRLSLR
jgi:hypothetical protein